MFGDFYRIGYELGETGGAIFHYTCHFYRTDRVVCIVGICCFV